MPPTSGGLLHPTSFLVVKATSTSTTSTTTAVVVVGIVTGIHLEGLGLLGQMA